MNLKKVVFVFLLLFVPLNVFAISNNLSESFQTEFYEAKVTDVLEVLNLNDSSMQKLEIEILNGKYKGKTAVINNTLSGLKSDIELSENDKINVIAQGNGSETSFYFSSYSKSNSIYFLIIFFIVCVIIIGKMKGFKALISLMLTVGLIIFGLIPLLLRGYNPVILGIITCLLSTVLTFAITNGISKKTLVAIIGVVGGLIVAGLIAYFVTAISHISGISGESEQMLEYLPGNIKFDYKGLLFAGIIIGALGACMDVAMELTSSLTEIKKHKPKIKDKELIKSGFNIGKDIMGTMVNTLILAYTGGSLSTILLFAGFEKNLNQIINLDSIAIEIIRAFSGSLGLLFAIPITIFAFVIIEKKENFNE